MQEDDTYVVEGPTPSEPLLDVSLAQRMYEKLQENINNHNPPLVDGLTGREVTYKQLLGFSCTLAKHLVKGGCEKGTIIAISSENSPEFFIPVISGLYIGATICPISNKLNKTELIHCLNITKPKIIFCSKSVSEKFIQVKSQLKFIERIIIIDHDGYENSSAEILNDLIKSEEVIYEFELAEIESMDDVVFVLLSSGTTGLPKGVMLTHRNMQIIYIHLNTDDEEFMDCLMGILPFYHCFGLLTNLIPIALSQKIIVLSKFEEDSFLRAISTYKVCKMWLVPPILHVLAHFPLLDKYDLSSVKRILSGAAAFSKGVQEYLQKKLNLNQIYQGYGLTEASLAVLKPNFEKISLKSGSCGCVSSYMKVKVRDPQTGKSLGPNHVGELCIKGPLVMKGYLGDAEATSKAFTSDGWLISGDLCYYDEDKCFFIVDRLKEIIKYKGFQVAPAELEALLLKHPEICDAAVVGRPKENIGELPTAFVVKTPNSQLDEKDVKDFVASLVVAHKKLRGGVIFMEKIPKSPSGKILRRELRNLLVEN